MARLAQFRSQYPEIELRLVASTKLHDLVAAGVDIAIRYGSGRMGRARGDPDLRQRDLAGLRALLPRRRKSLAAVEALLDETLLHLSQFDRNWVTWPAWLAAQGVKASAAQARARVRQLPRPAAGGGARRGRRPVRRPAGRGLHRPRRPGPPDRGDARAPTGPSTSSTRKASRSARRRRNSATGWWRRRADPPPMWHAGQGDRHIRLGAAPAAHRAASGGCPHERGPGAAARGDPGRRRRRLLPADRGRRGRHAGALSAICGARCSTRWSREHRGRVVKSMGDGAIVEFASVVDAVSCAVAMQRAVAGAAGRASPDERRIALRIGINLGDVVVERRRPPRRRGQRRRPAGAALRARRRAGLGHRLRSPARQDRPGDRVRRRAAAQEHRPRRCASTGCARTARPDRRGRP